MNTEELKQEYRRAIKKELRRCENLEHLDLIWRLLYRHNEQESVNKKAPCINADQSQMQETR